MPTEKYPTNLVRHDWLTDGPLDSVVPTYIEVLRNQRYADACWRRPKTEPSMRVVPIQI